MRAHAITYDETRPADFFRFLPTFRSGFDFDEVAETPKRHRLEYVTLALPVPEDNAPEAFTSVAIDEGEEREKLEQVEGGSRAGNDTLKRLAELEAFARSIGDFRVRDLALRSCRDAVTLVSFWPSDLVAPDADIDDDGIVSVEQFRDDGTLRAIFEFEKSDQATFAVLAGTAIVNRGYVSTLDPVAMMRAFEDIRSVVDDQQ